MLSTTDFTSLFIQFHQVMFRNDLWMLDPARDALLLLFPEGFWLGVTLRIAAMTGIECLMAGVLGIMLWRWTPGGAEVLGARCNATSQHSWFSGGPGRRRLSR
ncbi:MAG: DUF1461 domain-containing protein [Chloroflexi bacterium]|nr:DUF1461 domain-containing protein [Chloroflexota bacterium]